MSQPGAQVSLKRRDHACARQGGVGARSTKRLPLIGADVKWGGTKPVWLYVCVACKRCPGIRETQASGARKVGWRHGHHRRRETRGKGGAAGAPKAGGR